MLDFPSDVYPVSTVLFLDLVKKIAVKIFGEEAFLIENVGKV